MMRSPAISPTFSEGPPCMTLFTWMVSSWMVNWIPMPLKLPFRSAVTASRSFAGMYEECGSSSERICGMASSTSSEMFTVSTYCSSMMWSSALSLFEEVLMMPSLFPPKWLAKNVPTAMPATRQTASRNGMNLLLLFFIWSYVLFVHGIQIHHFDVCPSQQFQSVLQPVFLSVYHTPDARLDDQFRAFYARGGGDVHGGSFAAVA